MPQRRNVAIGIFKRTVIENGIVSGIANAQEYVDAVSKFLITQLGSTDMVNSIVLLYHIILLMFIIIFYVMKRRNITIGECGLGNNLE